MKRILAGILISFILISVMGCNGGQEEKMIQYEEDQVLFAAQNRYDIEDDKYDLYTYNYKGELLHSPESSPFIGYYAKNGLAPALDPNTHKVGYVDKDGVFQIEPKFDDAASFSRNGIALVKMKTEQGEDYRWKEKLGYINDKGEEITPCIYDEATSFFDCGYAMAMIREGENEREYVLNEKGKVVTEVQGANLMAVYKEYYVAYCPNEGAVIFDYSNNKITTINEDWQDKLTFIYKLEKENVCRITKESIEIGKSRIVKKEQFDGKKFVEEKIGYEIGVKRVSTTQSGWGYGIAEKGKTVIPFEYDEIIPYGSYFIAIKYIGSNEEYDQILDIYDQDYNKTAENIEYAFFNRSDAYGLNCQLPNGYFPIITEVTHGNYSYAYGVIDYAGNVIVEPVFPDGIQLYTYEGTGVFDWEATSWYEGWLGSDMN